MNKFVKALTSLDLSATAYVITREPKWLDWSEPSGKNGLHYVCGVPVLDDPGKAETALATVKLLLNAGMDINSVHRIEDKNCEFFPATPLWYAYTRGRNEKLYEYLLKHGADPSNCWWAIAWYDDVAAGKFWIKHGAKIDERPTLDELFLGAFQWKKYNFTKWLLDQGAEVNAVGPGGMTALMLAVKRKDEEAVRVLMRSGADADKANEQGISARNIAATKGPRRIMDLLSASEPQG